MSEWSRLNIEKPLKCNDIIGGHGWNKDNIGGNGWNKDNIGGNGWNKDVNVDQNVNNEENILTEERQELLSQILRCENQMDSLRKLFRNCPSLSNFFQKYEELNDRNKKALSYYR